MTTKKCELRFFLKQWAWVKEAWMGKNAPPNGNAIFVLSPLIIQTPRCEKAVQLLVWLLYKTLVVFQLWLWWLLVVNKSPALLIVSLPYWGIFFWQSTQPIVSLCYFWQISINRQMWLTHYACIELATRSPLSFIYENTQYKFPNKESSQWEVHVLYEHEFGLHPQGMLKSKTKNQLTIWITYMRAMRRLATPATLTPALTKKAVEAAPRAVRKTVRVNMKNLSTSICNPVGDKDNVRIRAWGITSRNWWGAPCIKAWKDQHSFSLCHPSINLFHNPPPPLPPLPSQVPLSLTNHKVGDHTEQGRRKEPQANDVTENLSQEVGRHAIVATGILMTAPDKGKEHTITNNSLTPQKQ